MDTVRQLLEIRGEEQPAAQSRIPWLSLISLLLPILGAFVGAVIAKTITPPGGDSWGWGMFGAIILGGFAASVLGMILAVVSLLRRERWFLIGVAALLFDGFIVCIALAGFIG